MKQALSSMGHGVVVTVTVRISTVDDGLRAGHRRDTGTCSLTQDAAMGRRRVAAPQGNLSSPGSPSQAEKLRCMYVHYAGEPGTLVLPNTSEWWEVALVPFPGTDPISLLANSSRWPELLPATVESRPARLSQLRSPTSLTIPTGPTHFRSHSTPYEGVVN